MIALTRQVSSSIGQCELTHLARRSIDLAQARAEHALYEAALGAAGVEVRRLAPCDVLPDAVFVEDTAVVLDEIAVITRPGAASRRPEVESVRQALAPHRPLATITAPGTVDGGDVLVLDRDVLVGRTARTNEQGIEQLRQFLSPHGYRVRGVPVTGCLHLKSAATRAGARSVVVNPVWLDLGEFDGWDLVTPDRHEPFGANVLWLGAVTIVAQAHPRTADRLASAGIAVHTVPADELALAEGGVTCCSLLVRGT
jgi:dimethylargininase